MQVIQDFVDAIEEELHDAQKYAEKSVEYKAKGNMTKANKYREMASDELKHAMFLHEWVVKKIEEISKVYTAPVDMASKWEKSHQEYVEKAAWVRQMLEM